jgi:hypothetical protein
MPVLTKSKASTNGGFAPTDVVTLEIGRVDTGSNLIGVAVYDRCFDSYKRPLRELYCHTRLPPGKKLLITYPTTYRGKNGERHIRVLAWDTGNVPTDPNGVSIEDLSITVQ